MLVAKDNPMLDVAQSMRVVTSEHRTPERRRLTIGIASTPSQYDSQMTSDLLSKVALANDAIAVDRTQPTQNWPPGFEYLGGSQWYRYQDESLRVGPAAASKPRIASTPGDMNNSYTDARPLSAAHGQGYGADISRSSGPPSLSISSAFLTHSPAHQQAWSHSGEKENRQQGPSARALHNQEEGRAIVALSSLIAHSPPHFKADAVACSSIASTSSPGYIAWSPLHVSSSPFVHRDSPDNGNTLHIGMPAFQTAATQAHFDSQPDYASALPGVSMMTQARRCPEFESRMAQEYQWVSLSSPSLPSSSSSRTALSRPDLLSIMSSTEPDLSTLGSLGVNATHRRAPAACKFCGVRKSRVDSNYCCRCARRSPDCVAISKATTCRRRRLRANGAPPLKKGICAGIGQCRQGIVASQAQHTSVCEGSKHMPSNMVTLHHGGLAKSAASMAASSAVSTNSPLLDGNEPAIPFPVRTADQSSVSSFPHQSSVKPSQSQHLFMNVISLGSHWRQHALHQSSLDQVLLYKPSTTVAAIKQAVGDESADSSSND